MIIDIIAGLVVLASALISFMRGFIREVLTIAGVVGGSMAAIFIGPSIAPTVREWFGVVEGQDAPPKLFDIIPMEIVADITTYGVIFIAVVIVISVISHVMSGAAKAVGLGPVDRTLGVIFGIARAALLLGLVYLPFHLLMDDKKKEEVFADSQSHYFIEKISTAMAQYLPESDDVKESADDLIKKKLEEQNLLGGGDGEKKMEIIPVEPDTSLPEAKSVEGDGYKDEQREKLDKLFNDEPVTNQPPTNQ